MIVQKLSDGTYRIKQKDLNPETEARILKKDLDFVKNSHSVAREEWARYRSEKSVDPKILANYAKMVKDLEKLVKEREAEYKKAKQNLR